MDIGIGLPSGIPGARPELVIDWARSAEEEGFASVACVDRVLYDTYDPLVTLSSVAAVTTSIELVTSILIAPLREISTLTKQVASLDALSKGRLTLGVAIGARGDDYEIGEFGRQGRGNRLEDHLDRMVDLLADDKMGPSAARRPRPRILAGGSSSTALARMARGTDGYIHGGGPPRSFAGAVADANAAWTEAGRPGKPQMWAMVYFALGGTETAGRNYLMDYYAFTGSYAVRIADGLLTTPQDVREYVHGYRDAGCNHLLLFPTVADPEQVNLLADALPASGGGGD